MKKIKIIDLLNMISKGEEVPKRIKVFNHIFKRELDADDVQYYLDGSLALLSLLNSTAVLNNEVEIIEEEPEIDIQGIKIIRDYRTSEDDLYNDNFEDFRGVINDLVQAVKQLDNKINNK